MEEIKERYYTMKNVSEKTGLSNDLIRLYEKEFALNVDRTEGGHRRYTEKNIEMLLKIKEKVQVQNWSYQDVRDWLMGVPTPKVIEEVENKNQLIKEVEEIKKTLNAVLETNQALIQANVALAQRLDEKDKNEAELIEAAVFKALQNPSNVFGKLLKEQEQQNQLQITEIKTSIQQALATKEEQKEEPKKGFFRRIFGG